MKIYKIFIYYSLQYFEATVARKFENFKILITLLGMGSYNKSAYCTNHETKSEVEEKTVHVVNYFSRSLL